MKNVFFRRFRALGVVSLAVSAFSFLLTSCEPDDLGYQVSDGPRTVTIGATSEQPATKAEIGDDLSFSWTPGDEIAVWAGSETAGQYYPSAAYVSGNRFSVQLSGTRRNFAVYPAGIADDDNATSSSLKVTLPAEYDFSSVNGNYSPMPMLAVNTEGSNLEFKHLGGLIRIAIGYLPAGSIYATVDLGKKINGSFPVHVASDGSYIVADEGDGTTSTKFLLPSAETTVLNLPVPTGEYSSITVKIFDASDNELNSESPEFSWNCRRAYGKKLADEEWVYVFGDLTDATVNYEGGSKTLASAFVSYRKKGTIKEAVPYTLEYSEDGGENWTTTKPTWLSTAPAGGDHAGGDAGEALDITVDPQEDSAEDPHHVTLSAKTLANNFDLSTINVATGATVSRTTANCYVVQAPGTYKLPLVYGNGVVNEAINEGAYRAKAGPDATEYRPDAGVPAPSTNEGAFLGRFLDHMGNYITNPYIATQLAGKTLSAALIWQDAKGLVTVNSAIDGSGENAYLTFSVPADNITQGNALIAVLADGVVAWSWHIWVTDSNLTETVTAPSGYSFPHYNLGWCDRRDLYKYVERSCLVRAVQTGTNATKSATVLQQENIIFYLGNSPFYQWGRKDPIQASDGIANPGHAIANKTLYDASGNVYSPQNNVDTKATLGKAIQTPYAFYSTPQATYAANLRDWCSTTYYNLWNSAINGAGEGQSATAVTKTVYDPSPVGFVMPPIKAFEGFNATNLVWTTTDDGDTGRIYNQLFFPASGTRSAIYAGRVYTAGQNGYFWTAVPCAYVPPVGDDPGSYVCDSHVMHFFGSGSVTPRGRDHRAYGFSVRPVRE